MANEKIVDYVKAVALNLSGERAQLDLDLAMTTGMASWSAQIAAALVSGGPFTDHDRKVVRAVIAGKGANILAGELQIDNPLLTVSQKEAVLRKIGEELLARETMQELLKLMEVTE